MVPEHFTETAGKLKLDSIYDEQVGGDDSGEYGGGGEEGRR